MVINTNTHAIAAASNLSTSEAMLSKSLARLSSGSKIVNPADDAAGLAVSMRLDAQIARITAAKNNVGNAISFTQTQDGYLKKMAKALDRMSELSILAQDAGIAPPHQRAMMNLTASHDTPRFSTSVYNPGRYKYHDTPREDSTYRIDRPDDRTRRTQELILVEQFTQIGAPHIWNGDEVGMWGADDPDGRKPMVWADLHYDDEVAHPSGRLRHRDPVVPDTAVRNIYRELISLRMQHLRLFVDGSFSWLLTDDTHGLLAYERTLGDQRAIIAFNNSDSSQDIALVADGSYRLAYPKGGSAGIAGGKLMASLPPRSARVWVRE